MSLQLHGYTILTLTKHIEKRLDGNWTRTLQVILNKSWKQHPTKELHYAHLPPSLKPFKVDEGDTRDTAGEVKTNSWATLSNGPLHTDEQELDDLLDLICNSSVWTQDVVWKICLKQWIIGIYVEKESGKSVLALIYIYMYIYIYIYYVFIFFGWLCFCDIFQLHWL